jgi:hypothetical protein
MTRSRARITGAVYLLYFVLAVVAAALVNRGPVVYDAANLIANAVYVALSVLLYQIFKLVNRNLSVLAVIVSVVGCIIQSMSLFHLAQPQSALPVFGLFNLTIGYLIVRSPFLPHTLGVLMVLSGFGWLTVLSPALLVHTKLYIEILGIVAEGSLMLWLLVMSVDVQRWNEQPSRGRSV